MSAEILSSPLCHRLGLTLLHFLWQGAAIAALAGIAAAFLRPGRQRYGGYLVALAIMALCPMVTFTLVRAPQAVAVSVATQPVDGSRPLPIGTADRIDPAAARVLAGAAAIPAAEPPPAGTPRNWVQLASDRLRALSPRFVIVWCIGVGLLSLRLLFGVAGIRRWKRHLRPIPRDLAVNVAPIAHRLGFACFDRVYLCDRIHHVLAVGCWRPMVLLPTSLISEVPAHVLDAVIAHELAHIRRHDLWINLAQRIVETILFYHPAIWWLSARVRAERELCCDELAVAATGQRVEYAAALEAVAARSLGVAPMLSAALTGGRSRLVTRIRHILGMEAHRIRWSWPAGIVTAVVMLIGIGGIIMRPSARAADPSAEKRTADWDQRIHIGDSVPLREGDVLRLRSGDDIRIHLTSKSKGVLVSMDVHLDEEGVVSRPFIDKRVKVLGLTYKEAAAALQKACAERIPDAQIKIGPTYNDVREQIRAAFEHLEKSRPPTEIIADEFTVQPTPDGQYDVWKFKNAKAREGDSQIQAHELQIVTTRPAAQRGNRTPNRRTADDPDSAAIAARMLERRLAESVQERNDMDVQLSGARQSLGESHPRIKQLQEQVKVFDAQIQSLRSQLEAAHREATSDREKTDATPKQLMDDLIALEFETGELQKKLAPVIRRQEVTRREYDLKTAVADLDARRLEAEKFAAEGKAAEAQIARVRAQQAEYEVEHSKTQLAQLRKSLEQQLAGEEPQQQHVANAGDRDVLDQYLQSLLADRDKVVRELDAVTQTYGENHADVRQLRTKYQRILVQINQAKDAALQRQAEQQRQNGFYYVGGDVTHSGAYNMGGQRIRLLQALIAAGVDLAQGRSKYVSVIRRDGDKEEPPRIFKVGNLIDNPEKDILLQANDTVLVSDRPPVPTTKPIGVNGKLLQTSITVPVMVQAPAHLLNRRIEVSPLALKVQIAGDKGQVQQARDKGQIFVVLRLGEKELSSGEPFTVRVRPEDIHVPAGMSAASDEQEVRVTVKDGSR